MITLILGGARSGKSSQAENLAKAAEKTDKNIIYIATATADDDEMRARIKHHQNSRPSRWQTLETPVQLADTLRAVDGENRLILVDCLTLWLTNVLCGDADWATQKSALLKVLPTLQAQVILVSNETGLGVVPLGQLTRQFVDEAGWLHQDLAKLADTVLFCVAGLPMTLKSPENP